MPNHDPPVSHTAPKCPACGACKITFAEIIGPLENARWREIEILKLKQRHEAKLSEAATPQSMEDLALLQLAPHKIRKSLSKEQIEQFNREYAAEKELILAQVSDSRFKLAVVYCYGCGHFLGTAESPLTQGAAVERLERGLQEVCQAIGGLQAALAKMLAGVHGEVGKLNSREESRDRTAAFNDALTQFIRE